MSDDPYGDQRFALAEMRDRALALHHEKLVILKSIPPHDPAMRLPEAVGLLPTEARERLAAVMEETAALDILLGAAPTEADLEAEVAAGRMTKRSENESPIYSPIPGAGCRWEHP